MGRWSVCEAGKAWFQQEDHLFSQRQYLKKTQGQKAITWLSEVFLNERKGVLDTAPAPGGHQALTALL